jgi:2-oxoglutarate dehydrogenase E2 component (dihydrolipoamide succinyltransferase)
MPQRGETVTEGTISKWHKKVGESVKSGEILFEIETDKTSMEIPATIDGKLSQILVAEGNTSSVGSIVAIVASDGEDANDVVQHEAEVNEKKEVVHDAVHLTESKFQKETAEEIKNKNDRKIDLDAPDWFSVLTEVFTPDQNYSSIKIPNSEIKLTPLAKRIASNASISLDQLADYCKSNNIKKVNRNLVETFITSQSEISSSTNKQAVDETIYNKSVTLNRIRRTTAQRLSQSWSVVPQAFQAVEVNYSNLDVVRSEMKEKNLDKSFKISYLSFIARAIAIARDSFPLINSTFNEKEIVIAESLNLSIAVDLKFDGLIVPVIKGAENYKLTDLNDKINDLVDRAQNNGLEQEEHYGGTYTISNNGSMGTYITAPIVNPPQVAIMSFDGITKKPVIIEDENGDKIGIRKMGVMGQSFDHRAFDGAYAASFLKEVKTIIEDYNWQSEI